MASLQKVITTHWLDADGKRAKPNSSGAHKVRVKSKKWYIVFKEDGRLERIACYTDKASSQRKLSQWLQARERGDAGLIDPYREHRRRPLRSHVDDYLVALRRRTSSPRHHREAERILTVFLRDAKPHTLNDLTADRITQYLSGMTCGPATRNMHRRIISGLCNWLVGVGRLERSPITKDTVKVAKAGTKRRRRALTADELRSLIDAAAEYPVASASVNRGGRNAKAASQVRPCKLRPETLARLQLRGRERRLLYRLAVLTGLRRGELSRLRVLHLELDRSPFPRINLPGELTKNGKPARLRLIPSLVEELRGWLVETGKRPKDLVVTVPSVSNLVRLHKAHLARAAIAYQDDQGRFADFHSLRTAANTLLRQAGIPAKERQLFLRHGKMELTTEVYDDADQTDMQSVADTLTKSGL